MRGAASGVRALVSGGVTLSGGFVRQVSAGAVRAAGINNLAAAAAVVAGGRNPWPAIPAMALGPNLVVTASIACLVARQMAGKSGRFGVFRYSAVGALLLPVQRG